MHQLSIEQPDDRPEADDIGRASPQISYYGLPAVKHSHYHWKTALGFLAEALGGAPQILATLLHMRARGRAGGLVRAGRYLGLAGALISPALLISELHSPRRWFNMLRIFRPTSPMSIGNMSLTFFGLCSGVTAIGQLLEDLGQRDAGRRLSGYSQVPAAFFGGMLCLYPGTELEETCTPLWSASHPLLAPLFAATGLSIGAAALTMASTRLRVSAGTRHSLNQFALLALASQLATGVLVQQKWQRQPFSPVPHSGIFSLVGLAMGVLFPLLLRLRQMATGKERPEDMLLASAATLTGGYLIYEVVLEAGNASAEPPAAYLAQTRANPEPPGHKAGPGLVKLGFSLLAAAGMALLWWNRRQLR